MNDIRMVLAALLLWPRDAWNARQDRRRWQATALDAARATEPQVEWAWDEPERAPIDMREVWLHADPVSILRAFTTTIQPIRRDLDTRGRDILRDHVGQ